MPPSKPLLEMTERELTEHRKTLSYGSFEFERVTKQLEHLQRERLSKPHWTMTPSFLVAVIGISIAAVGSWCTYLTYARPNPSEPQVIQSTQESPPVVDKSSSAPKQ